MIGSPVHGILQAQILEWAAIAFSGGSSPRRDRSMMQKLLLCNPTFSILPTTPSGASVLEEPRDPVTSPPLFAVSLDLLGSGSGSVFPVSAARWQRWGAEATERGVWVPDPRGALGDRPPGNSAALHRDFWGSTCSRLLFGAANGVRGLQALCGLCRAGLGTHQEAGGGWTVLAQGQGTGDWGNGVRASPSAHTHLQEVLGRLTSCEKAARGFSVCFRPSMSSGSRHRNAHTTQSASGRGLSSQDRQRGLRLWSPKPGPASPLTVPMTPRGPAGRRLCFSISGCVKEGGGGFPSATKMGKNLPASAGDVRDEGPIPRLGRSPGGGNGNPLQLSCLEIPVGRGAWRATVHGLTKSWT